MPTARRTSASAVTTFLPKPCSTSAPGEDGVARARCLGCDLALRSTREQPEHLRPRSTAAPSRTAAPDAVTGAHALISPSAHHAQGTRIGGSLSSATGFVSSIRRCTLLVFEEGSSRLMPRELLSNDSRRAGPDAMRADAPRPRGGQSRHHRRLQPATTLQQRDRGTPAHRSI
jgi:hypothetical protein